MSTNSSAYLLEDNYRNAVDAEVAKESKQLDRMRSQKTSVQRQIAAYEEISSRINTLNQASKDIYSFNSPFRNLVGVGDGVGEYYDVFASRMAQRNSEHAIEIKSIAKSQKFASKPFAMKENIAAGDVSITIGTNKKTLSFEGGSLVDFKRAFDKEFADEAKTTIVQKTKNLQVIIFEITKTGISNSVTNFEDTSNIISNLNLFGIRDYQYLNFIFSIDNINEIKDLSENLSTNYFIKNDFLIMDGINKISLNLHREAMGNANLTLSLSAKIQDSNITNDTSSPIITNTINVTNEVVIPNQSLDFNNVDSIKFGDIELQGESISPFAEERAFENAKDYNQSLTNEKYNQNVGEGIAPPPQTGSLDYTLIAIKYINVKGVDQEKYFQLPTITADWQRLSIPLTSTLTEDDIITDVIIMNNNRSYSLYVKDILIEEKGRTEYVANYPIDEARDARIIIDGIEVSSESNEIKDAIEGVNVIAKKITDKSMNFNINIDKEKVAVVIVDFVGAYNYALEFANITLQRPLDREVKASIDDMNRTELLDIATENNISVSDEVSDDMLRRYLSYIGIFNGNVTISTLKQKMQLLVVSPYPTKYGAEIALLSQIGIDRGKVGEAWENMQAGFLKIDEDLFLEKVETYTDGVEELFVSSTDPESSVPNDGVAFKMSNTVDYYSRRRGIIDTTVQSSKEKITAFTRQIEKEVDRVNEYRKLREGVYYNMDAQLKSAERETKSLENRFQINN